MSDLSTSLKEILNERISSPFYGSLIVSWLLWNWKIPYVTFFVDQNRLGDSVNKIDYIITHCSDPLVLFLFPVLSTAVILLGMPYITNGASWVTERFDTWRVNKKNEVQGKRQLTVQESLKLRIDLRSQEEEFNKLLIKKDEEIKLLNEQLELASKHFPDKQKQIDDTEKFKIEFSEFLNNKKVVKYLEQIEYDIRNSYAFGDIPKDVTNYYVAYDLIKNKNGDYYSFTSKGEFYYKTYIRNKLKDSDSLKTT